MRTFSFIFFLLLAPATVFGWTCEELDCPTEGNPNYQLPLPSDCSKYCVCDWGKGYEASCPEGLEYNAALQGCDWPERAQCKAEDKK